MVCLEKTYLTRIEISLIDTSRIPIIKHVTQLEFRQRKTLNGFVRWAPFCFNSRCRLFCQSAR
eukprot:scaffold4084_cov194-Amphora_coffeaeformis.AAC.2